LSLLPASAAALTAHFWPANVRELQNCIFRALNKADKGIISQADLGLNNMEEVNKPLNLSIKDARNAT